MKMDKKEVKIVFATFTVHSACMGGPPTVRTGLFTGP